MAMNVGRGAEMNVTPLIDVLLVLIIIFMVIAPTRSRGLQALVPEQQKGASAAVEQSHPVVVTVRRDGTAALNQEVLDLAALRSRLEELYRKAAARVVFIRGEKDLEFGRVADVIALARDAGVSQVALMTN
jgi:biopolymer transport protein ExbD